MSKRKQPTIPPSKRHQTKPNDTTCRRFGLMLIILLGFTMSFLADDIWQRQEAQIAKANLSGCAISLQTANDSFRSVNDMFSRQKITLKQTENDRDFYKQNADNFEWFFKDAANELKVCQNAPAKIKDTCNQPALNECLAEHDKDATIISNLNSLLMQQRPARRLGE